MPNPTPRVQAVPQPDDQVSFQVDRIERLRWHFARRNSRPHFYPLIGPSGVPLTRMGHPAAPDHDHHKSLWFAHNAVEGLNFWAEGQPNQIRQDTWVLYQDGDDEAAMVAELGWYDGHNARLIRQELIAALRPLEDGELLVELQATFHPNGNSVVLRKTNFGLLAVRVAKSISHHYGGGRLHNSEGAVGEPAIFGGRARWMDYSGPVLADAWEGITYLDHPSNVNHPNRWHVRDDGWMSASVCMDGDVELTPDAPLVVRYQLHAHSDDVNPAIANSRWQAFADSPPFELVKAEAPLRHRLERGS
jgi:hypothetical protein